MVDESSEITKVQELIYTSRVETVMAKNVVVLQSDMTMAEVKEFMRKKRISGSPVIQDNKMVGIVTMADVIDSMERGQLDAPVTNHMTQKVTTIFKDAPVTEAISLLGREGHGRIPVVNREDELVGIVTTGTIIRALLHEMDIRYRQRELEKLHTYRASHIFQDILSDDTSLILRFVVADKDFSNAGKASSSIKKSLMRLGMDPSIVRRVAVAVYEAEMNLVIHTDVGGEIIVDIRRNRLKISAIDHGPGISDIKQVLQPGYSTAPEWIRDMGFGAGMGLANIRRCSDLMQILSAKGSATRLDILFLLGTSMFAKQMDGKKS